MMDRQFQGDSDDDGGGEEELDCDKKSSSGVAATSTTVAAPSCGPAPSGGISRRDFDRISGPLVDHFFPDGPPPQLLHHLGSDKGYLGGSGVQMAWPSSSSWHTPSKKCTSSCGSGRNSDPDNGSAFAGVHKRRRRSRRVAVSVDDARDSLLQTLELRHGCERKQHQWRRRNYLVHPHASDNGFDYRVDHEDDGRNEQDRRMYLSSSQASALVWTACEMLSLAEWPSSAPRDDQVEATALRSPLATHRNFRRLLRSIRICGDGQDCTGESYSRALLRALLKLASFLRPCGGSNRNGVARKAKIGNGRGGTTSTVDATKSQSTIVQFLHLLSFCDPPETRRAQSVTTIGDRTSYDELRRVLFPLIVSCCVHADTPPLVRVDACRWIGRTLEWDRVHATELEATDIPSLRRVAQQVRLRLKHMMTSLHETRPSKKPRRDDQDLARDNQPSSDKIDERAALASVLDSVARFDPTCQDLVLVGANIGSRYCWHEFPHPQWEDEFAKAYRGLRPASSTVVPHKCTLQRWAAQDSALTWLSRLCIQSAAVSSREASVLSSRQRRLGMEDDAPPPGRPSSSSILLGMLRDRNLHHRLVLSSSRWRRRPQREGEDGDLNRLDTMLPFLLTDYAASPWHLPASAPVNTIADHHLSQSIQTSEEGATKIFASVMVTEANALLADLYSFSFHANELPPAVQTFVETQLLPNWDGSGSLVPSIVSFWNPSSFEELYRRVLHNHIEPLLVHGDTELQYRIVSSLLTPMVERWCCTIMAASKEEQGAALAFVDHFGARPPECQILALRRLIGWVDETLIQLFVRSDCDAPPPASKEDMLQLACLRFFVAVGEIQCRFPEMRLNSLPSPPIVYRLLLSPSPFILDRIFHVLASFRPLRFSPFRCNKIDGSMMTHKSLACKSDPLIGAHDQADAIRQLQIFISDACLSLLPCFRQHSLPNRGTMLGGHSSLFAETVATRETMLEVSVFQALEESKDGCVKNAASQAWFQGAAFCDVFREYVQQGSDEEKVGETENGGMRRQSVEERYLDYLQHRGFTGIHELCSSSNRGQNGESDE